MKPSEIRLSPAQQEAFDLLRKAMEIGNIGVLYGETGSGKSTILREYHNIAGGTLLGMKDFMELMEERHPLALEEAFHHMVTHALRSHNCVILDDLHVISNVVSGCQSMYLRAGLLDAPLKVFAAQAEETGKKLVFATEGGPNGPISERCYYSGIDQFTVADYEAFATIFLGVEKAAALDFNKVYRFARHLNAHQLKSSFRWLKDVEFDTDAFIDYLREQRLTSNVSLGEVQAVEFKDLKGVDDVLESLEANIILPLENDALTAELNLKPKRGVLLAGPPGTGKTTIGRALAHRLKSKFFLIDGTFISGSHAFYQRIHQVFEEAKNNAPSIIFIDDSDAIFQSGEELGRYRYLLTMLDGLESTSAGRVCVMMTAMNVGHLPPALIRSGRIELWLETRLPDAAARRAILQDLLAKQPAAIAEMEIDRVVGASEDFTGADLKRLVEDAKTLYAYDRSRDLTLKSATDYFLAAIETVRANKERYEVAEAETRQQHASAPSYRDVMGNMMANMSMPVDE